jgi:hypothetical protein
MTGRIIEEGRRKLKPKMVEIRPASRTGKLQKQDCNRMWRTRNLKKHLKDFILIHEYLCNETVIFYDC